MYKAINKKFHTESLVTDEQKKMIEEHPSMKGRYRFEKESTGSSSKKASSKTLKELDSDTIKPIKEEK
jgi:2-oxo-4-hydroxy-4-carboxy--5-ureidoimidazoline (OHCU) decarboxylase